MKGWRELGPAWREPCKVKVLAILRLLFICLAALAKDEVPPAPAPAAPAPVDSGAEHVLSLIHI
eukprot:1806927-Alexandrium_andersonii.AAC.1